MQDDHSLLYRKAVGLYGSRVVVDGPQIGARDAGLLGPASSLGTRARRCSLFGSASRPLEAIIKHIEEPTNKDVKLAQIVPMRISPRVHTLTFRRKIERQHREGCHAVASGSHISRSCIPLMSSIVRSFDWFPSMASRIVQKETIVTG